jgi:16S rRNA U516 pseudouridylate synthase RsuA-like enzyme
MVEHVWGTVKKLKRIRIENIQLWDLEPGDYQELSKKEKDALFTKLWIK